ncbi:Ty3/gypsy retrotransposon protein [Senna tora]|uniref:Ty3/gypsy retrotransposon protein n=1 Tax=Senna tora TaxID=362788 RepID=A0A834TE86_9FABA|nr:Ty3/gypsy retrotransposon protein [Senna tora]
MEMNPSKDSAILKWPCPTNVKQLRGFLGLTGYYCRFINRYAHIAAPLTSLLKKDGFNWNDEALAAFNALKQAVTSAPVLILPYFSKPFIIDTDALVITEAIAKFRHSLFGDHFIIRTDQNSLHHINDQKIQSPKQEEWLPKLLGYQFSIEYKPGRTNTVAGALSRSFHMACSSPIFSILDDVRHSFANDAELLSILRRCQANDSPYPQYTIREGVLCWMDRVVIIAAASELKHRLEPRSTSSAYHPQTDGQIRSSWIEYWYNTATHSSTGMTPFKVVYGRDHRALFVTRHLLLIPKMWPSLCKNVMHCYRGSVSNITIPLPLVTNKHGPEVKPQRVVDVRQVLVGDNWKTQVLIKWEDPVAPSWEPVKEFNIRYPAFDLEDKVNLNGKGDVMTDNMKAGHMEADMDESQRQGVRRSI